MKFFLKNQEPVLHEYLEEFKALPFSFESTEGIKEKLFKTRVCSGVQDLRVFDFSFLFHYFIFPPHILNFYGEWQCDNREMQVGDTIVLQAKIPPIKACIKLVFGVRVLSITFEKEKVGFSYGTLVGHPEVGVNEFFFSLEKGDIFASVHTTAGPGLLLSKVMAPVFTKPYVNYCNSQALLRMKKSILKP